MTHPPAVEREDLCVNIAGDPSLPLLERLWGKTALTVARSEYPKSAQ